MSEQSPFSPYTDEKLILDKVLGDAYLTVKFVAQNIETFKTAESIYPDITVLGPISSSLEVLASNLTLLQSVDDNYTAIVNVSNDIAAVTSVSGIISEITSVSNNLPLIQSVDDNASDISTVAENISDVISLSDVIAEINTLTSNIADIQAVAGIANDIPTVALNTTDINTVAAAISNVNDVANSLTDLIELHTAIPTIQQNRDDALQASIDAQAAYDAVQLLQDDLLTKSGNLQGLGNTQESLVNLGAIPSVSDLLFNTDNSAVLAPDGNNLELELPNKLKIIVKRGLVQGVTDDSTVSLTDTFGDTFEQPPMVIPLISPDAADYPAAGNEQTSVVRLNSTTTGVNGFWFSGDDADVLSGDVVWGYAAIGKLV